MTARCIYSASDALMPLSHNSAASSPRSALTFFCSTYVQKARRGHREGRKPMSIKPLGKRDHRIDILRALALLSIFINHIPGNVSRALHSQELRAIRFRRGLRAARRRRFGLCLLPPLLCRGHCLAARQDRQARRGPLCRAYCLADGWPRHFLLRASTVGHAHSRTRLSTSTPFMPSRPRLSSAYPC